MKPIIYKENVYEIVINGDDIHFEGLHQDLILVGAYLELKREAIDAVGYYRQDTLSDYDGTTFDYDKSDVDYYIDQSIEEFIDRFLKAGKNIETLTHNNN